MAFLARSREARAVRPYFLGGSVASRSARVTLEMQTRLLLAAATVAAGLYTAPLNAAGDEPHRLDFPFREASTADYAVIAGGGVAYGVLALLVPPATDARWASPVLFDRGMRSSLLAPTRASRARADLVSDIGVAASLALLAGDSILVAGLLDDNFEVASELFFMDAQVFALSGTLIHTLQLSIARERPDSEPCRSDSTHSDHCDRTKNTSFPSGHATTVFASAATYCAHRFRLELYGHPAADAVGCGVQVGGAFATALLRVVADRHHATDVAAGALLGTTLGLGVPLLVRASTENSPRGRGASFVLAPSLGATPGLVLAGSF
jgi:membrane-associated phospholipid phosphatase